MVQFENPMAMQPLASAPSALFHLSRVDISLLLPNPTDFSLARRVQRHIALPLCRSLSRFPHFSQSVGGSNFLQLSSPPSPSFSGPPFFNAIATGAPHGLILAAAVLGNAMMTPVESAPTLCTDTDCLDSCSQCVPIRKVGFSWEEFFPSSCSFKMVNS